MKAELSSYIKAVRTHLASLESTLTPRTRMALESASKELLDRTRRIYGPTSATSSSPSNDETRAGFPDSTLDKSKAAEPKELLTLMIREVVKSCATVVDAFDKLLEVALIQLLQFYRRISQEGDDASASSSASRCDPHDADQEVQALLCRLSSSTAPCTNDAAATSLTNKSHYDTPRANVTPIEQTLHLASRIKGKIVDDAVMVERVCGDLIHWLTATEEELRRSSDDYCVTSNDQPLSSSSSLRPMSLPPPKAMTLRTYVYACGTHPFLGGSAKSNNATGSVELLMVQLEQALTLLA